MKNSQILFDGYCPESLLKGKRVEMKLNEDDFWESLETGLQITVFPPFAAILRWRGKGGFRATSGIASNVITGLILTETSAEDEKEIFPDETKLLQNFLDIEQYLNKIYKSKEEFDVPKFSLNKYLYNGHVLEESNDYRDAVKYLNMKFGKLTLDEVKEWLIKNGTNLSNEQKIDVSTDLLRNKFKTSKPDIIWDIEDHLEMLAINHKISTKRLNG